MMVHNLNPNVFGTHSFRISVATTRDSGHVEADMIQKNMWRPTPLTSLNGIWSYSSRLGRVMQVTSKRFLVTTIVRRRSTVFEVTRNHKPMTQESLALVTNRTSKVDGLRSYKKS